MTIEELIRVAAAAMKMPESMVRRSAEARAQATGRPIEQILGEWGEVDPAAEAPPSAQAPAAAPAAAPETPAPATPSAPAAAPTGGIDPADLLAKAAESQGLPEAMVRRSAAARAKAEGKTTDEILAEWAGVDLSSVTSAEPAEAPAAPPAAPAEAPPAEAPAPAAPAPAAAVDSADLLAKAAAAQGLPEAMVRRSAAARGKAEGKSTEAVLAEWAGVEVPAASAAPSAAPASAAAAPAAASTPAEPAKAEVEVIAEEEATPALQRAEEPERELVTPSGALPRWLAALFVAVPLFAVAYAGFLPNGPNCGDAGQLAVDPVTGVAVNCDGSEYGSEVTDYFAIGAEVYGARCAVCHGPNGSGVADFPPFVDGALLATFPEGSCDQHQQWVTLGSSGWPDPTYGANDKPVGGLGVLMPGFGNQLTEEELNSVVLFERVQFGGLDLASVTTDCSLDTPEE